VAAILSVVESCRRMGIPVRQYLLSVLPGMGDRKVGEVAELTPTARWRRRQAQPKIKKFARLGMVARLP